MIGVMQHCAVEGCSFHSMLFTLDYPSKGENKMLWRWKFGVFVVAGKAKMRFFDLAGLKPLPSTGITSISCRPALPFTFAWVTLTITPCCMRYLKVKGVFLVQGQLFDMSCLYYPTRSMQQQELTYSTGCRTQPKRKSFRDLNVSQLTRGQVEPPQEEAGKGGRVSCSLSPAVTVTLPKGGWGKKKKRPADQTMSELLMKGRDLPAEDSTGFS